MTEQEALIRAAVEAEADQAVDPREVLAALRTRRRRRRPVALFAATALTAAAAAVAVAVPLVVDRDRGAAPATAGQQPAPTARTVLLLGLDDGARPDAVVLARVGANGSVGFLSLPRDTRVDVPGVGAGRLNQVYYAAHQAAAAAGQDADRAGAESAVRVVAELTGVPVDHYATVPMAVFGELVDAVGGVEVCLREAARDPFSGLDLPAGTSTLGGADALAFLRQRHGLPNGDLDRVVRHQAFLRALAGKVAGDDPARLAALGAVVRRTVRTDPGWDPLELAGLLAGGGAVRGATIPTTEAVETGQGMALAVDPAAVREFTRGFLADPGTSAPAPPPAEGPACVG
ncbi:LCP family protein [Saccharothrix syringae]|uniref:LytR family transcriptional regulator n=1 Tax=Saccharothrix syringae TaxID=103733 RepID=A0A5Q0H6A4_SACSY|nr:LCP family protein [Saccharothrix syringae]QFZ21741.1 LytR family transcriptional regulator [Saccharothrix syringae]